MRKILYVGWIGFRNLGDELMWHTFRDLANKYLDPNEYQVIPSVPGVNLQDPTPYDIVVLGGGSLLIPGYLDVIHRAIRHQKKVIIWGSGYDSLESIELNNQGKLSTNLARGKESFGKMVQEVGEQAAYFGVRGPLTHQLLEQLGGKNKTFISGDPGLLVLPENRRLRHANSSPNIIGVNWGTSYNRIYGKNEEKVENALATTCKNLIREGYRIYLFTMWDADAKPIKRLYDKIGLPAQTVLDPNLHNHHELIQIMQTFTATINFKLHANVLSAAAGIPFVCLAYRFKSIDFALSLDLPETLVLTDTPNLEDVILNAVTNVIAQKEQMASKLQVQQQRTIELLEQPFQQKIFN